jgi:hypothetical protein
LSLLAFLAKVQILQEALTKTARAAKFAGEILEEETLKWNNRQSLVHRQLNNPTFIGMRIDNFYSGDVC